MRTKIIKVSEELKEKKKDKILKRNTELSNLGKTKMYREAILYGEYKRIFSLKEIQKII